MHKKTTLFWLFSGLWLGIWTETIAQNCPQEFPFQSSSGQLNRINWKQFPAFSLPFNIVYGGPRLGDTESLPLTRGFTHVALFTPNEQVSLPVRNRALLWYNVAGIGGQPWNELSSPYSNDLPLFEQKWRNDLAANANIFRDSEGKAVPLVDYFILDIERNLTLDRAIRELKQHPSTPASLRTLSDVAFTDRYKRDLTNLYGRVVDFTKKSGMASSVKIGSYADAPIPTEAQPLAYDWEDWKNGIQVLNYLMQDSLSRRVGGSFYNQLQVINPSIYFCYEGRDDGRSIAYAMFQMEANRLRTDKELMTFVWLKYNRCLPSTNYDFRTFIQPNWAEALAVFPFFSGSHSVFLWEAPTDVSGYDFSTYEHYLKGLYRLSLFKDFFTGTYELFAPKTAYEHYVARDVIWRAVIKDGKVLVMAMNPFALNNESVQVPIRVRNLNTTLTLRGNGLFLCSYDLPAPITSVEPAIQIKVYPNPSESYFVVENTQGFQIETVYELTGRQVAYQAERGEADRIHLKLTDASSGSYFVLFRKGNLYHSVKLVQK
jgi:Secretion system C-terminal sorting domain